MSALAGAEDPPALELEGVRACYGRIEVLHGVSLALPRSRVMALLGPNGAGKSTTLKVASCRLRPSAGTVRFAGRPVDRRLGPDALARSGVCSIPEGRGVFPNLTVAENLRMWTFRGVSRSEVEERTYQRFPRLKERAKQLAGTLSGGEQQMLAMSRALSTDPSVLLLDEISMGLAPIVVAELYETVAQLARQGIAILIVEQFAKTALAVADEAAIMVQGRIEARGSPEEIADRAAGAYLGHSRRP
ncbi:MAG TPA: ABC transporter ATP-binding protein [Acidimicrobiales bacterium]|nr:ABC transporter ATP-binding protein [Acidimicrobiales bacterium]